jgi:hypothetical protein
MFGVHIKDVPRKPARRTRGGSLERPLALTKVLPDGVSRLIVSDGTGHAAARRS